MSDEAEQAPMGVRLGQFLGKVGMVAGVATLGVAAAGAMGAFTGGEGHETGQYINTHTGQLALMGAGGGAVSYILGSSMDRKAERIADAQVSEENAMMRSGGFVAAEETKAIQGLMKARLMSTNPEYFAQMSQGRGT